MSHKSQKHRGEKERKVQDRDRLESPPEKNSIFFCLLHRFLTLILLCQHKVSEMSLFINHLFYSEYFSVAQNISLNTWK